MGTDKERSVVNMKLYLDFLYIGAFLFVIGFVGRIDGPESASMIMALGYVGIIAASIRLAVMLYRLWEFVIDALIASGLKPSIGSAPAAVGKLFIPVYNFYWLFVCLRGLSNDLSALAASSKLSARVTPSLATAVSICSLLGCIPFVNFIFTPIASLILWPLFVYKISSFAGHLKIYRETGIDLFSAHDMARKEMILASHYGDLFPRTRTSFPLIGRIIVLVLISVGCYSFFAELLRFWGFRMTFFMPGLFAVMIGYAGLRLKSPLLSIGTSVILSSLAAVSVGFTINLDYSYGWIVRGGFFAGFLMYALFFPVLLALTIRFWGARWWSILLAYAGSFVLFFIIGQAIYGRDYELYTTGLRYIYAFLYFCALTAALYTVFYFQARARAEERLLSNKHSVPAP